MIFIAQNHVDRHSAGISRHLCHGSRASARVCRAVSTSRNKPAHHLRSARNLRVRVGTTPDKSRSITYTYDALDRRKTQVPNAANTSAATLSFTLNEIGNRITSDTGGVTAPSRRNQTIVIAYGGNNRPVSYTVGTAPNTSATLVKINALGQRVRKTTGAVTTDFVYDESGQLIGEYDNVGNNTEHVWLAGMPIAVIRNKAGTAVYDLFYVHADHLGTPRAVTSTAGYGTIWTWDNNNPFGDNAPNERASPIAGTTPFKYNLRFPGQYYDQETGLSYNYFRDYDPSTGRYVQSDPIGLLGGINTFGYVQSSPLSYSDAEGLRITGSWLESPKIVDPRVAITGWEFISPYASWSGYINVVRVNGTVSGGVRFGVRCFDDAKGCLNADAWDLRAQIPISKSGHHDFGPNVFGILAGARWGLKGSMLMNGGIIAATSGLAVAKLKSQYGAAAGAIYAALLAYGPTGICNAGIPEFTN